MTTLARSPESAPHHGRRGAHHRAGLRTLGLLGLLSAVLAFGGADRGLGQPPRASDPTALARQAVDADPARAEAAIAALRALGPTGHARLLAVHADAVARLRDAPPLAPSPELERLRAAIDRVSGQRDGHASGLFFFDDLAAAQAEARRRGVPILSLRLLGRLTDELSCANSRYFRTLLYPDPAVAALLRDRFVLHVSTERPAPRITIDMGDGRQLVRTITGNSAHYVLDAQGRVIDVLPGLYAPPQFVRALQDALAVAAQCNAAEDGAFRTCRTAAHGRMLIELGQRWIALREGNASLPDFGTLAAQRPVAPPDLAAVSARSAMRLTLSKMIVEAPVLDAAARERTPAPTEAVDFRALATPARVDLDARSAALIRLKTGRTDVTALLAELSLNATADGLRNEFVMHRVLHDWLATQGAALDFATFNTRVYAELFLTPATDPWLGLRAPDVWDAIEELR